MGFFDFIFGKSIYFEDDFFGKMLFSEFKKKPENNFFECRRHFTPISENIEIGLSADISGPRENQKEFFRKIEENYEEIILKIKPVIEGEFRNWKEDFRIIDFKKEFKAEYLSIPKLEKKPIEWEISFSSPHDLNHSFSMYMKDYEVDHIIIDG